MQEILQKFVCRLINEDDKTYVSFREEDGYFKVTELQDIGILQQALADEKPVIIQCDECLNILNVWPGLSMQ